MQTHLRYMQQTKGLSLTLPVKEKMFRHLQGKINTWMYNYHWYVISMCFEHFSWVTHRKLWQVHFCSQKGHTWYFTFLNRGLWGKNAIKIHEWRNAMMVSTGMKGWKLVTCENIHSRCNWKLFRTFLIQFNVSELWPDLYTHNIHTHHY